MLIPQKNVSVILANNNRNWRSFSKPPKRWSKKKPESWDCENGGPKNLPQKIRATRRTPTGHTTLAQHYAAE